MLHDVHRAARNRNAWGSRVQIYMIASSGDGIKTDVNGATFPFSTDLIGGSWAYPNGTDSERQRVIDAHVAYTKGLLWFLQTDTSVPPQLRAQMKSWGWCGDEFKDNDHFPFQLYVRPGHYCTPPRPHSLTSVATFLHALCSNCSEAASCLQLLT
jgi:hypothetical protein